VEEARAKAAEVMKQAEKSRDQFLAEMDERVTKESIVRTCELIQDTLPEEFKKLVHSQWVSELTKSGFDKLAKLNLPEDIKEVKISTAFELSEPERVPLHKKIREIVGKDAAITEEVTPKVVAGIVIAIGSLVLDGSLKNKIQEKARAA
jgi:F0F1-type ATP synthase delta subunit